MTSSQIFEEIETGDVLADLRFASDVNSLVRRMVAHPVINEAIKLFGNDPGFRSLCVYRARTLLTHKVPEGFANPKRTAIAAYLHVFFSAPYAAGKQFIQALAAVDRADLLEAKTLANRYSKTISNLTIQPSIPNIPDISNEQTQMLVQRSRALQPFPLKFNTRKPELPIAI